MASPVSIGCPLSPAIEDQRTKTFSKNAFKPSLLGATAFDIQRLSNNSTNVDEDEEEVEEELEEDNLINSLKCDAQGDKVNTLISEDTELDVDGTFPSPLVRSAGDTPVVEKTKQTSTFFDTSGDVKTIEKFRVADANELDAFDFDFEGEGTSGPVLEDAFTDNMLISSPAPLAISSEKSVPGSINEEEVRNVIKHLIEMDADNMNMSTKKWMTEIAGHLRLEMLPKEWKGTIKSILMEEATSYTQTETETEIETVPIMDAGLDDDELEDSVGGLTPAKSSPSSLFLDREDGESDSDDNDNDDGNGDSGQDKGTVASLSSTPSSPPKEVKKPAPAEKNEELLVQEKLGAELSEREMKMMDYIDR